MTLGLVPEILDPRALRDPQIDFVGPTQGGTRAPESGQGSGTGGISDRCLERATARRIGPSLYVCAKCRPEVATQA